MIWCDVAGWLILDVIIASLLHRSDVATSFWRYNGVIIASCDRWDWIWHRDRCDLASLLWRYNGRDDVSNHLPHDCLLNCSFRGRSKKTSKLRFTGFCVGNSPVTVESPTQMVSKEENVSIWWRHHGKVIGCHASTGVIWHGEWV